MTIDITISLSDTDLERFQQIVDQGKQAVTDSESAEEVETAAGKLIQKAQTQELPQFVLIFFQYMLFLFLLRLR